MNLELKRFRREFRQRGGWTLTQWDGPSTDRTEIQWVTNDDGKRRLHVVIERSTLKEALEAVHSSEVLAAIQALPQNGLN